MIYFSIYLLYLSNLLHLEEFFGLSQIWTTSYSNNRIKWVEKWYSCYQVQCEVFPRKWKEISNILFRKHDHEHVAKWFLNSKKSKRIWKSWDLSRSYDIIRGGYGKNWTGFKQIYHVWYLQIEVSQKKNRSVEKDSVRFGVKVIIKLRFDFKFFV